MASVPLYGSNKQSSSHSMHCSSVGGTLWPVFLFMKLIRNIMIEDTRVFNLHFGLSLIHTHTHTHTHTHSETRPGTHTTASEILTVSGPLQERASSLVPRPPLACDCG